MTNTRPLPVGGVGPVPDEDEIEAVAAALRTGIDVGPIVEEFERRGADLLGKRHGVMVNSGTSALQLAVDLLECQPGDEVITSALTFSADIAPLARGGIVAALVDVEPDTFQIDVDRIEEMIGPRTKAILTPNLVGNCPDWDRIRALADAHGLIVVEDSCDVLLSQLRGTPTGARADIVCTSFARGHSITAAGQGGLIATDNTEWADASLVRRRWGRRSETFLFGSNRDGAQRFGKLDDGTDYDMVFLFDDLGYNFSPSESIAAYALVQLDKLDGFNECRQRNFHNIDEVLAPHDGMVTRPRTTDGVDTTWMMYPFVLADDIERTPVQKFFAERGVATRMVWSGNILRQPGFSNIPHRVAADGLPNADRVMDHALALPTYHWMSSDDAGRVVTATQEWVDSLSG
ncbi:MAG: DegT/DnrJ/EryC1/StrS family aminotransferase [Acidimicrobiia bacterium]